MEGSATPEQSITAFCSLTGASAQQAQEYLDANRWDISSAVAEFYTAQEEVESSANVGNAAAEQSQQSYTGPRTLDGRPAPSSTSPGPSWSARSVPPQKRGGIATLSSLGQTPGAGNGHHHGDNNDTDDEESMGEGEPRDLFAGGEKSGLAVQDPGRNDPRKVVNDIIKKAKANATRPEGEPTVPSSQSRFLGSGQTLGSDEIPSHVIPGPNAQRTEPPPIQNRILHLWEDGFSVDEGPLHRFDDSQNAADLAMIRQGRAPLHLMNVRPDQPIDVQLMKHDENYKSPMKVYKPFHGTGQRLGSPSPGGLADSVPPRAAQSTNLSLTVSTPEVNIDASQPTINLRIQLADGTRLPARFNTTHTIGDVYRFIERAMPASDGRPWILATTFPNKDHTEKGLALGSVAEFARGGTAVQKWK